MKFEFKACALLCSFLSFSSVRTALGSDVISKEGRTVPTMGVELDRYTEELKLELDRGQGHVESRNGWVNRVSVGFSHRFLAPWLPSGSLNNQTSIGLGYVYAGAQWPLYLRSTAYWDYPLAGDFHLSGGIGSKIQWNITEPAFSNLDLGISMGASWGSVDLVWYPHYVIPLGADREDVWGGELIHRTKPNLMPLQFILRLHFETLSF